MKQNGRNLYDVYNQFFAQKRVLLTCNLEKQYAVA